MWTWFKKRLPTMSAIKKSLFIQKMSGWIDKRPYLWKLTKHSVAGSIGVSLFIAFLPLPLETLLAVFLAILFRVNLPIVFFSTMVTNAFTLVPANYFSYKIGALIIQQNDTTFVPLKKIEFHWNDLSLFWHDFTTMLASLGKAYIVGLPIVSITSGLMGYGIVYLCWTIVEFFHKKRT